MFRTFCSIYHVFFVLIDVLSIWPKFIKIKRAEKDGTLRAGLFFLVLHAQSSYQESNWPTVIAKWMRKSKRLCFLNVKLGCYDYCTVLKLINCHFVTNVFLNKRPVFTLKSSCIYIWIYFNSDSKHSTNPVSFDHNCIIETNLFTSNVGTFSYAHIPSILSCIQNFLSRVLDFSHIHCGLEIRFPNNCDSRFFYFVRFPSYFLSSSAFFSLFHAYFVPSFRSLIWFVVSQWTEFPLQYSYIVRLCLYNKHVTRIECVTKCDMVTNILFQSNVLCQLKLLRYSGLNFFQTEFCLSKIREIYPGVLSFPTRLQELIDKNSFLMIIRQF